MFDLMFTIVPVLVIGMFIYVIVSGIGTWHKNNNSCSSRSRRNRQTRTFEGRMGDRMGSSPIARTKKITCTFIVQVFYLQGSKGLERDVKKTAQCAEFAVSRANT